MKLDYNFIINGNKKVKQLNYTQTDIISRSINFELKNNDTDDIYFIINPYIDDEITIFNVLFQLDFVNIKLENKNKAIEYIKTILNDESIKKELNFIYQVSVSNNYDIDILVRLFDKPLLKNDIEKRKILIEIEEVKKRILKRSRIV